MPELRFQATPRQWALIAVLCAVLVGVLIFNGPAESNADAPLALAVRPPAKLSHEPVSQPNGEKPRMPEFTADEVAKFNPFARPDIAPEQPSDTTSAAGDAEAVIDVEALRKQEREKTLAELRSKGVRFVIGDQSGAAALLGNQQIRIGEIVRGFRVIKIDQSGVVLEPAE